MAANRPLIPFGPGALVFLLAVALVAGAVVLFDDQPTSTELVEQPPGTVAEAPASASPTTSRPSPTPTRAPLPTPTIELSPPDSPTETDVSPTETVPVEPADLDVQVLVGTDDIQQVNDAIAVLEDLGYTIVDQEPSTRQFEQTTVFWTADHEAAAERLRAADPRFSVLTPAIEGLDDDIPLHIIVGLDWTAG